MRRSAFSEGYESALFVCFFAFTFAFFASKLKGNKQLDEAADKDPPASTTLFRIRRRRLFCAGA